MNHKEFKFNNYGVCLNPNETSVIDEKYFKAVITTALYENKWHYGYDWTDTLKGYSGAGVGASLSSAGFQTEVDAIRYAVEHSIINHLQYALSSMVDDYVEYDDNGNVVKHNISEKRRICQQYLDKCRDFIMSTYQLSLF